jgi:hypothetical protein
MAIPGRLRRLLQIGTVPLVLAATCSGAALAEPPDPEIEALRPPIGAPAEEAIAEKGDVAPARDANAEGDVALPPTAADLETLIERTLGAADLQALVKEAAGGAVLETDPRVRALGAELDVRAEALTRMFEMLAGQEVPPERLAEALATIVARHKTLLARVQLLDASDPRAAELKEALAAAVETADYELVDALLARGETFEFEAMRQLLAALEQRILNAAAIHGPSGAVAGTLRGYGRAAVNGALLHGEDRAEPEGPPRFVPSDGFCQRQPEHRLCERRADSPPLCDRLPDHPLCDDDRFCKKRPDHPLCNEDPPPSPS